MSTRAIEHCDLQLSDEDKNLLQYAAQLSGVSLACFIRQVRYLSSFFSRNFPKKSLSIIQLPGRRPGP